MSTLNIPVFRDVMCLFNIISFTGASTFVLFRDGSDARVSRLIRGVQYSFSFCVFLLLLGMSIFECYQFVLIIWQMSNIGEIIPNIMWLTSFPLAIMAQVFYTIKRPHLLQFFERWQRIHDQYSQENDHFEKIKIREDESSSLRMYFIYFLTVCLSVAMVIVVILDFPILPFLPSTKQQNAVSSVFNYLPLICVVFAVSLFYAWNLSAASDLVPSLIYYHLATELDRVGKLFLYPRKIQRDGEKTKNKEGWCSRNFQSADPPNIHKIWIYYEAVRGLIEETNSLFGLMLLLNHGAMFFVASSNIFAILRWYQGLSWLLLLVNGYTAASTILRVTSTILLCSRLSTASDRLQNLISSELADSWYKFHPSSDRQFYLAAFLTRVQDKNGTIASPLGLYFIKPSMILTLLSLLATYLIVLLQSSELTSFAGHANFTGLITGTYFYTRTSLINNNY